MFRRSSGSGGLSTFSRFWEASAFSSADFVRDPGAFLAVSQSFGGTESGRGLPRAGCTGGQFCERDFWRLPHFLDGFRRQVVARGRATSIHPEEVSGWRRFGMQRSLRSHPRVNTRGSPKRNSVRFANSITAFH